MATGNAQKAIQKWKARTQSAVQDYKDGVNSVTESPTQKAAQAVDKYALGCQRAVTDGTFVDGCNSVSTQEWKDAATGKGAQNFQTGVSKLSARAEAEMNNVIQFAKQLGQQVRSMPNVTEADAEQRMLANVRGMREYRKGRR